MVERKMKISKKKLLEIIEDELRKDAMREEEEGPQEGKKNPWKICTAEVGREDKKKYEDCVLSVKGEK
jgi:hypothetical protein